MAIVNKIKTANINVIANNAKVSVNIRVTINANKVANNTKKYIPITTIVDINIMAKKKANTNKSNINKKLKNNC